MKLSNVLTSTTACPQYLDFIPIFIDSWNYFYPETKVSIVLIANELPSKLEPFKDNIILFRAPIGLSQLFCAQVIRLLYPALLSCEEGVLITDMDDIPLSSGYFMNNCSAYSKKKFISYRDRSVVCPGQISIMYNIATPQTWAHIFNIHSTDDLVRKLIDLYEGLSYNSDPKVGKYDSAWFSDQRYLCQSIDGWSRKSIDCIELSDKNTGFNRLCRSQLPSLESIRKNMKNKPYTDYHMARPQIKFKKLNTQILELAKLFKND
jgi:hypothetical protein